MFIWSLTSNTCFKNAKNNKVTKKSHKSATETFLPDMVHAYQLVFLKLPNCKANTPFLLSNSGCKKWKTRHATNLHPRKWITNQQKPTKVAFWRRVPVVALHWFCNVFKQLCNNVALAHCWIHGINVKCVAQSYNVLKYLDGDFLS